MFKRVIVLFVCFTIMGCQPVKEATTNIDQKSRQQNTSQKILIAYFSWADNTMIDNEEDSIRSALEHYDSIGDSGQYVDASSTASLLQPGNVSRIAKWIQEDIGGNLFSIQVQEEYPGLYDPCLERASQEKAENARPQLKAYVNNMDEYDTVFIGYPNWWYSVPMPVLTFIEEHDLSNKNVILFCSHGTGGLARSVDDIQEVLPDTVYLEENVIGIYRDDILNAKDDIDQWLQDLGYKIGE